MAAGLWHTVCISADGDVYAFGGNQFGQLGTGTDQAEVHFEFVSCTNVLVYRGVRMVGGYIICLFRSDCVTNVNLPVI